MAVRKQYLLRIDPSLWAEIEKWAGDELRSVNGQIEFILARAVKDAGRERKRSRPEPDEGPAGSP